ncbi:MAG: LamG-like jellyroll fold domain-containing protein [Bacillota bacterium]
MAIVYEPDLNLYPQPDGSAQADTGLLRATLAGDLAAQELLRVEVAQTVLQYATGGLFWVDTNGTVQPIAAIASAPLQVDGSVGRFAPEGAPYTVEYEVLGNKVKRRVILTAPLPDPDPAIFPDLDDVYLSVLGPLNVDPTLTVMVEGQPYAPGQDVWTAATIDLVDADGRQVEKLERISVRGTGDETLVCAGRFRLTTDPVTGQLQIYECLPYWWLKTVPLENYPVVIDPTVVATVSENFPTSGRGKRIIDRCSDGTLWIAIADGSKVRFLYSKDNGSTWLESTSSAISGLYTVSRPKVDIFIDVDDYLHIVYDADDGGGGDLVYRRGTPNASRTAWTWSQAYVVESRAPRTGTVVAHREGSGWVAHIVWGLSQVTPASYISYSRATIGPDGSISLSSKYTIASYSEQYMPYVAIDFNHTGDGKTVAEAPHLYVAWSGPIVGFKKATYSSGNWTWGNKVTIDSEANSGRLAATFDGTRFVMVYSPASTPSTLKVAERDAADTTTTFRNPPALSDGTVIGVTLTYDQNQNLYVFAAGNTSKDVKMVKFDRSTSNWGSWTTVAAATAVADTLTSKRGYGGNALDVVWSDGASTPYTVYHHAVLLNRAPNAPTVTVSPAAFDASTGTDITIRHNDPDGDQMSGYALKRVAGSTTQWWRASDKTWVSSEVWNAASGTSVTIPAADNAGKWDTGVSYQLYAATKDAQGVAGPYNSTGVTANAGAKPIAQITAPTGTVAQQQVTVEWTVDQPQSAYRLRLKAADGTVLEDTGKVSSTDARARTLSTVLQNNSTYTVELTVWDQTSGGGVQSDPVTASFTTSFTQPLAPLNVTATPDPAGGKIDLQWSRGVYRQATFARASVAYDPETGVQVAAGVPRYGAGRFGQGILIEESITNLLSANQSSVETDTSGFQVTGSGAVSISRDTNKAWHGAASLKVVTDGAYSYQGFRLSSFPSAAANTTYTGSVHLQGSGSVVVELRDQTNGVVQTRKVALTGTWTRVQVTLTTGASATSLDLRVYTDGQQAITFWADGLQIEQKPYATSWTLGGTTRAAESVTLPTEGVLNPTEGTIEGWFLLNDVDLAHYGPILSTFVNSSSPGPRLLIMRDRAGSLPGALRVWDGDGATEDSSLVSQSPLVAGVWYHFAFVWGPNGRKLYLNGVPQASSNRTEPLGMGATLMFGEWGPHHLNGMLDEVRISHKARTDEEIAAAYASGQPFTVDEYTTALLRFDGTLDDATSNQNSVYGGSWRVERRPVGATAWTPIAVVPDPPSGQWTTYSDYAAASGVAYEYRVVALGNNTTEMPGDPVAARLDLEGVWLHDPRDPAGTARQYNGIPQWDEDWQPVSGEFRFAGRTLPVVEFDESQAEQVVRVQLLLPDGTGDREALEALAARRTTVLYRDYRGRKVYGTIRGLRFRDEAWGAVADLEVYAVEYEEAVG